MASRSPEPYEQLALAKLEAIREFPAERHKAIPKRELCEKILHGRHSHRLALPEDVQKVIQRVDNMDDSFRKCVDRKDGLKSHAVSPQGFKTWLEAESLLALAFFEV